MLIPKLKACSLHLLISVLIGLLAAFFVFSTWYPAPYAQLSGGLKLFFMILGVDIILGPLLTFIVFNPKKPKKEKLFEFVVIATIQASGLFYGGWTIFQARPAYTVFEYDRFRIIHTTDIPEDLSNSISSEFKKGLFEKPKWLALRPLTANEQFDLTISAASGGPAVSALPHLWIPYTKGAEAILKSAQPYADLATRFPERKQDLDALINKYNINASQISYLPIQGREDVWTVLLDSNNAQSIAFIDIDSFKNN